VSFATPWWIVGLLGGAVAAGVIALYLLRRTPRPQIVSNLAFWIEALQRARPKLLASTRIPILSLLLSLLVALLLVAELGGPRFGEGVRGTTVLVVSASRSMGAREGGTPRIDRAVDEARRWADRATASGEVAVVRAGVRPSVIVPLTGDDAAVADALDDFTLDDGPADLDEAVALADEIVSQRGGNGQIIVVADSPVESRTRAPVVLVPAGAQADTVALARLVARRDPVAVGEYAVEAQVRSFTSRQSRARLVIRDRDVVILDQAVAIGPYETVTVRGQGFSSAQAELTARLEEIEIAGSADALASDDVAYAVAAPLETIRVAVGTDSNPWLERVLSVHPSVDARFVSTAELAAMDRASLAAIDVLVVDGAAPVDHPAVLVIDPTESGALALGEAVSGPRVTATLASHGALGGVRLDSVRIERARPVELEAGDRVLVRSGSHALAIARERGGRRLVALGFALEDTDLVEQVAFPLVVHHTLRWLAAHDREPPLPAVPGEPLVAGADATVLGPDGEPMEVHGGIVDDTERAGIYHVAGAGTATGTDHGSRTTDDGDGDGRAYAFSAAGASAPLHGAGTTVAHARSSVLPPLATLIAIALLLFIVFEWLLLHRGRLS
jgi:hypothetical protein